MVRAARQIYDGRKAFRKSLIFQGFSELRDSADVSVVTVDLK
jgi:hypothetical protein